MRGYELDTVLFRACALYCRCVIIASYPVLCTFKATTYHRSPNLRASDPRLREHLLPAFQPTFSYPSSCDDPP